MEQVGQAGEQVLLPPRLTAVCQDLLPKGSAEVQSLQHRVAVAGVPELKKITYGIEQNQISVSTGGDACKTVNLHGVIVHLH